jgi:hypothetical protein
MFDSMNTATHTAAATTASGACELCVPDVGAGVPTVGADPTGAVLGWGRARRSGRPRSHLVLLAGEGAGSYDAGAGRPSPDAATGDARHDGSVGAAGDDPEDRWDGEAADGDLRAAVRTAAAALREVRRLALDTGARCGELGALIELLPALDAGHAAAVGLADRIESQDVAPRRAGLPLEALLAFQTRLTFGDRRTLFSVGTVLRRLPTLRAAFADGAVGWAQVRAICAEARVLDEDGYARLDATFGDRDWLCRTDPDRVVDEVRGVIDRCRPDLTRERSVRRIEHRFLHVQPALDGALTGYFELDPEAGATVLAGLEAAMPPPSAGPRDVTADAMGEGAPVTAEDGTAHAGDGGGPVPAPSRARQRADGLLRLAECFLGGGDTGRRPRPRIEVVADIATLTGHDDVARDARLLWSTIGAPPRLTPEAVRRLASDADLRFLLTDAGRVLGVSAPTPVIPPSVRAAVHARDQGCRFPGCSAPVGWTDLHHVRARADRGWTVVNNLVALCRRHHTAVTEGRWRLTMTADGVVTVRRGRHRASSDPPLARAAPPPVDGPRTPGPRAGQTASHDPPSPGGSDGTALPF